MANVIAQDLEFLRSRIKGTSSVRFNASRRVRTNYKVAQLTVVVLSLWAIFISYALATDLKDYLKLNEVILTAVGVILPVFIVVFSLLENGEDYLRAFQLEHNARQLRELSDQLYTSTISSDGSKGQLLKIYADYTQKYSDCIERSPINHDEIDHLHRMNRIHRGSENIFLRILNNVRIFFQINLRRILYVAFWIIPISLFYIR